VRSLLQFSPGDDTFTVGVAMKVAIGFLVVLWLLCGLVGAWWMEGSDNLHWKTIARGPISLVEAYNENPMTYPGPN
jgi:hypothetical protein